MTIKIALTNLGKYNEGELVFEWIELPADSEKINEALEAIGIDGEEYEEYFISDYEAPFEISEYASFEKLNEFAEALSELYGWEAIASGNYDAGDVINFSQELSNGLVPGADEMTADIISDEELDEMTANIAREGGWQRVKFFLGGIDFINDDYYRLNGYGNVENIENGYLSMIVGDLIDEAIREYGI